MSMSVQKSQVHKTETRSQDDDKRLCLVNDLKEVQVHIQVKIYGTSSSLKSMITTSCSQDEKCSSLPFSLSFFIHLIVSLDKPILFKYQGETFPNDPEDSLTSTMMLLAREITQGYSTPTNNRICSSSNTRNQAIVQADRGNIQSKNIRYDGIIARYSYNVQEETVEGSSSEKRLDCIQEIFQAFLLEISQMFSVTTVTRKKDEAGSFSLTNKMIFFFLLSCSNGELGRVQTPSTSNMNPLFTDDDHEQTYHEQPKIIKSIIGDDQIDINIIFDDPNVKVNNGNVDHDKNVHDSYELEQLASKEEHEVHLKIVLELLKKEKLFAKCEFSLQEVHFLRYVVNSNDIHVDSSKIEVMKNWKFAKPLTSLTQKDQKYEWGVEQEKAFQTFKDNLCNAPIYSLPDGSKDFVVYCDASNQGLRCVSMQRGKVIVYASRQFNIYEKNFTIHDFKRGVVVLALKTWRHYLYGTKSIIYTDHKSLQHIFDQKKLNMRQRRWIELNSDYDCEIRYHPGKANVVADALSKKERVKPRRLRATSMPIQLSVTDKILVAQSEASNIENAPAEMLRGMDKQMEKKEVGGLYFMDRIWVPLVGDTRIVIMNEAHSTSYHSSIRCAPFEALYGRKYRSPVLWAEIGESRLIGPELVQETTDKGDPVAYRLRSPQVLSSVHDTFHVSNLKKCLADANLHVPLGEVKIDKTLRFVEEPVEIMDREVKKLKRSRILIVKVCWNSKRGPEFTWER
ncbi:putative reverse transcriptase domain-containing protein [Tanacetum coccineum]